MILSLWKDPAKTTSPGTCLKPTPARMKAVNIPMAEIKVYVAHLLLSQKSH